MKRLAGGNRFAAVLLAVASVAACATQRGAVHNSATAPEGVQGLQVKGTANELSLIADLVVLGVARDTVIEPFTANKQIPPDAHDEVDYASGHYAKTQITVEKVLKGDPPKELTTGQLHSLRRPDGTVDRVSIDGGGPGLRRGVRYVLFLERGASLWSGHYLAFGGQGVGVVEGDLVRFNSGETLQMARLISQIQAQVPPPGNEQ